MTNFNPLRVGRKPLAYCTLQNLETCYILTPHKLSWGLDTTFVSIAEYDLSQLQQFPV